MTRHTHADVAIVGAGIVGLAHALSAGRRGKRVTVFDRSPKANGASIRNFGFVTVTGQEPGETWRRARRSRDIWLELAARAGIPVAHRGLGVVARRPEATDVLEAFLETEMGTGCALMSPAEAQLRLPALRADSIDSVLWSPHEVRVESRTAIPCLANLLAAEYGVDFQWSTLVRDIDPPDLDTSDGPFKADVVIVCPGDDRLTLYPKRIAEREIGICQLHMMRVTPGNAGFQLGAAVMSDLGLVRYRGYTDLPGQSELRRRIEAEQPDHLANGIHLIAVQSADGSLVVGDSHHYDDPPAAFADGHIDNLILEELHAVVDVPGARVTERWLGTYATAPDRQMFVDAPDEQVRIVMITSGTGASTAFAIAEEVIGDLYGVSAEPIPA